MPAIPRKTISDTSSLILNTDINRESILIRCLGDDTFFGFQAEAVVNEGIFLKTGEGLRVDGNKAKGLVYAICPSGKTSELYIETTNTF